VVRLLERGAEAVEVMLEAAPRVMSLLDEAEALLRRADELLDRVDQTRASADDVVRRTDAVVGRAETLVDRTGGVVDKGEATLAETEPLTRRLRELLDLTEPSLVKLQPVLERLAETTHPEEVDALVQLVDHLPMLADRMESEIVPIVESMGNVGPDIHDLLDLTRELNEMLASVPGLSRVKKRIDEEQADNGNGDGDD
jgi:ABC-type transporter Mla subunit MlaD